MLSEVSKYRNERVEVARLSLGNYISTENMLPNKDGVTESNKLPTGKTTSSYQKGDILISNIRPYFKKIWHAENEGGCSNDVLVIRANKDVDSKFLYYVLADDTFFEYDTGTSKGTKMPRGDKSAIMQYQVPDFSIENQRKIASVLTALDNRIAENKKINHHLEQMAYVLYKAWFIDFEPFGWLRPQIWKDSLLFELSTVTYGKNLPTKKLLASGYRVFGGNGQIGYYSKYLYKAERILISCRGAASGSVRISRPYSFVTNNSLVINEKSKNLFAYVRQWALNRQFFDAVTGSAQPQVTVESLKFITLPHPDEETLDKFSKLLQPIYDMIERKTNESEQLIVLRDALLPKLMSGELSVKD